MFQKSCFAEQSDWTKPLGQEDPDSVFNYQAGVMGTGGAFRGIIRLIAPKQTRAPGFSAERHRLGPGTSAYCAAIKHSNEIDVNRAARVSYGLTQRGSLNLMKIILGNQRSYKSPFLQWSHASN